MQNIGNVVQGSESAFSVAEFDLRVARANFSPPPDWTRWLSPARKIFFI